MSVRIPYIRNEIIFLKEYYYEKQKLFVIILFSSEEKSIKKVAGDTIDCVPRPPQLFYSREYGIVSVSRD